MSKGFKSPVVPLTGDSVLYSHSTEKVEPASTMAGVITADMSSAAAKGESSVPRAKQRAVDKRKDAGGLLLRLRGNVVVVLLVGLGEVDGSPTCRLRTVEIGRGDGRLARRRSFCNGGGGGVDMVVANIFRGERAREGVR